MGVPSKFLLNAFAKPHNGMVYEGRPVPADLGAAKGAEGVVALAFHWAGEQVVRPLDGDEARRIGIGARNVRVWAPWLIV